MNTCEKGVLGEAKTIARLAELGWSVFTPLSGHAPFDLIGVSPEGNLYRISVKSCFVRTKYGSYDVTIAQVQPTSKGWKQSGFNVSSCDILACYLGDIDKVCFINAKDISSKNKIALRETASKMATNGSRVIEDFFEPKMQA